MAKISGFEIPRPIRLKAFAARLRQRKPGDPHAMKVARNLEAGAKFLIARAARRQNDHS